MTQLPLSDFIGMAERAASVDDTEVIRFRAVGERLSGFVRLPYDVVAGRTVALADAGEPFDLTVGLVDFLAAGETPDLDRLTRRDANWLAPLPPHQGWRRRDRVPDSSIRELVRSGALLARAAETRAGQESLLSAVVLTVEASDGEAAVEVPLGPLSALTKMAFLPRSSEAAIDTAPGWLRVAAPYGSTYLATSAGGLGLLGALSSGLRLS